MSSTEKRIRGRPTMPSGFRRCLVSRGASFYHSTPHAVVQGAKALEGARDFSCPLIFGFCLGQVALQDIRSLVL